VGDGCSCSLSCLKIFLILCMMGRGSVFVWGVGEWESKQR